MLFSLLIGILILACISLLAIGAVVSEQRQADALQREVTIDSDEITVELGRLAGEINRFSTEQHRAAKLALELQSRKQMADIIG